MGYWQMMCWNSLSADQQRILLEVGCLPFGRKRSEGGSCNKPAECEVTTQYDVAPGPRFMCLQCAAEFLSSLNN